MTVCVLFSCYIILHLFPGIVKLESGWTYLWITGWNCAHNNGLFIRFLSTARFRNDLIMDSSSKVSIEDGCICFQDTRIACCGKARATPKQRYNYVE